MKRAFLDTPQNSAGPIKVHQFCTNPTNRGDKNKKKKERPSLHPNTKSCTPHPEFINLDPEQGSRQGSRPAQAFEEFS